MRDEIDSRFWVENHEAFGREINAGIAALRGWLGRTLDPDGAARIFAVAAAFAITLLTLNTATLT
ncbi:MAG: hypothetical protein ACJ8ER_09875 [Allosphingosinicella sp.]